MGLTDGFAGHVPTFSEFETDVAMTQTLETMSRLVKNLSSGFPTRPNTNWAVQPQKIPPSGLKFGFKKLRDCIIYVGKTKALIN